MSRRRVLMLLENDPYHTDRRVTMEARALLRAGYRVSVISPMPCDGKPHDVDDGVRLYRYPTPPSGDGFWGYLIEYGYATAAMLWLSFVALLREGFDIVHAHNPPDTLFLIAAPYKLFGKRFVYDQHDLSPELYRARFGGQGNAFLQRVLALLERATCGLADHVIAANDSHRALLTERDRVPPGRVTVVRNAPDPQVWQAGSPDRTQRPAVGTVLGYAGRMSLQDGVDYLIRALHHLIHDLGRDDFLCILVGAGEAVPGLKTAAHELGLDSHVQFTGWVDHAQVIRYLGMSDICLAPEPSNAYNDRSTAIKVMEYMAAAKPIVAFDLPEHRHSAQAAALYAKPNDELDFARQIAWLMDHPEQCGEMGAIGRERIEKELAWSHQAASLLKAYETLSQTPAGRSPVTEDAVEEDDP